jgi:hypothetical protein
VYASQYLSLNFGAIFPWGLRYFALQKIFNINSKGESHLGAMYPLLKSKICITGLEYLLKKLVPIFRTFIINKLEMQKNINIEKLCGITLENITKEYYIHSFITRTYLV